MSYTYGKPTELAYRFAEKRLRDVRTGLFKGQGHAIEAIPPLRRVYMVGDNPDSDIAGPNTYKSDKGTEWAGLLVKTGVWDPKRSAPFTNVTKPLAILDNVNLAVRYALEREGVLERAI